MNSINEESGEPEKKQSYNRFPTAVISLVNSHLGAGMLGIPLAYAKAGLVPAIILHILMGLISWFSYYFLIYSSEATGQYSYGDLAEKIFGIGGILVVEICNFSYTFFPLWAYLILIGDFIPSLLRMMGVDESNIFCQRWFIILIVGFFVLQPLSWFRTLDSLKYFSSLGMFSMMLTVIVMIIRFFLPFNEEVDHSHIQAFRPSFSIVQTFSTLCFAFGCQQNIPLIHSEIKERSTKRMNYINILAVLIVGTFYMIAGIFGYISFTQLFFDNKTTSGNLLTLYADKDPLAVVARIASLITVLFCCPMQSLPARIAFFNIIKAFKILYTRYNEKKKDNKNIEMKKLENNLDENNDKEQRLNQQEETQSSMYANPLYQQQNKNDEKQNELMNQGQLQEVQQQEQDSQLIVYNNPLYQQQDEDEHEEKDLSKQNNNINNQEKQKQNSEKKEQPQQEKDNDWWTSHKIGPFTYDFLRSCAIGSMMVLISIVLAIFLGQVNFVFDILGSTAGSIVAFLVPSLIFWRIIRNPARFVDQKRPCYSKTPEGIAEHDKITEKMLIPDVGCTSWSVLAWFVFICGVVFGILSLAMAIIFDTSLGDNVNW